MERSVPTWSVRAVFAPFPENLLDDEDKVDRLMEATGDGLSYNEHLKSFSLCWNQDADTLDEITKTAAQQARSYMEIVGHGTEPLARIEIHDYEQPTDTAELDKRSDIAFWLGVSRQRVDQIAKKDPNFPVPVMKLEDGTPLYKPLDVLRYTTQRNKALGKDTD
jgi:hypothetical protein